MIFGISRSINQFSNLELHQKCQQDEGCDHIKWGQICDRHVEPTKLWTKLGGCASRTHILPVVIDPTSKKKINPMKLSKRGGKR